MADSNSRLNGGTPGNLVRNMAGNVAKQAMAIAEGTDERVAEINRIAQAGLAQLTEALERFRQQNRDNAAKLAEAVTDQFGLLAQKVDDLSNHCSEATVALKTHRDNIQKGLAALQTPPEEIKGPVLRRAIPRQPEPPKDVDIP